MLNTFRQAFKSTNKDLRNRIIFTLVALSIFSLGNSISVPGTEKIAGDLGFLELLNAMAGGGLKNFSIFALGVMPYITASIVMQLLQMDIIPYFKELKERGEEGRRKINQITRYAGIGIAFVQGYLFSAMFLGAGEAPMRYLEVTLILTAGTAFLLWLGDQITSKGLGNGISLIIMAGIVNTVPNMFAEAFTSLIPLDGSGNVFIGIISFLLFVVVYLGVIVGIIFIQQAERRLPIQYSNRTMSSYGSKQSYLPIRLNSAGVIPVIFASALITVPTTIAYFSKSDAINMFINKYLSYSSPTGFCLYIGLIIAFVYLYTYGVAVNPKELSKNLNKGGGYIPGIRPGTETTKYVAKVLGRITFMGAIFLAAVSALPIIFTSISDLPSTVRVGGTGLLIVVGVVLETYKQLESSVASRNYNRR